MSDNYKNQFHDYIKYERTHNQNLSIFQLMFLCPPSLYPFILYCISFIIVIYIQIKQKNYENIMFSNNLSKQNDPREKEMQ